jgi:molybdate transport system substrate-binding protein
MAVPSADSAEIRVLASIALKGAYLELAPRFERASGARLATEWAGTGPIMERMQGGESADLVIGPAKLIDQLIALGKIVPGSRADIARSGIGVAVQRGAPRPDLGSADALKRALLLAKSIAYSSGPSGVYLAGLFRQMGIAEELRPKVTQTPPGTFVGELVARGEAEIGFQQVAELFHVGGAIDFVGRLPPEIQQITVFSGGIHAGAKAPGAARALLRFLTGPDAAEVIRRKGMEPG